MDVEAGLRWPIIRCPLRKQLDLLKNFYIHSANKQSLVSIMYQILPGTRITRGHERHIPVLTTLIR